MYEGFFHLRRRPFPATTDISCIFASKGWRRALERLRQSVEQGYGIGLLIGPAGTGKTLLCQRLLDDLAPRFARVLLTNSHFPTRRALLQAISHGLGLPYRGLDEQELRLALGDFLEGREAAAPNSAQENNAERRSPVIVIVDEAHLLPARLLEELRMLTNLQSIAGPAIRLILSGQPGLEELLGQPPGAGIQQRIAARAYLTPFTGDEAKAYLAHRIGWAGGRLAEVLTPEAQEAAYRHSEGVARLLNALVDQTMLAACQKGIKPAGADLIDHTWAEIEQLPAALGQATASAAPTGEAAPDAVIEFGAEPDAVEPPAPAEHNAAAVIEPACDHTQQWPQQNGQSHASGELDAESALVQDEPDDDDELVIDRYAALDARRAGTPQAIYQPPANLSLIERALARSALAQTNESAGHKGGNRGAARRPSNESGIERQRGSTFGRHERAQWQEGTAGVPPAIRATHAEDELDLIVVEREGLAPAAGGTKPARLDYRELFSRMRRG